VTHSPQNAILVFALSLSLAFGQMVCLCTSSAGASEHMTTAIAKAGHTDAHSHHTHHHHSDHAHQIAAKGNQIQPCDSSCEHCDVEALQQNDNQLTGRASSQLQESVAFAAQALPSWPTSHSILQSWPPIQGRAPPSPETLFLLGQLLLV